MSNLPLTKSEEDQLKLFQKMTASNSFNTTQLEQDVTRSPQTGRIVKGPDGADDQLIVTFSTRQVPSAYLTVLNEGVPSYIDMDFITIFNPQELNLLKLETPVTDYYQWRFPLEYKAFKDGKDVEQTGTPLKQWNQLQPGQIDELKTYGIVTVEQIAGLSESSGGSLKPYARLSQKAKNFLESISGQVADAKIDKKISAERDSHKAELEAMKAQIDALVKLVAANAPKVEESIDEVEAKPKMRFGKPIKPKSTEE